MTVIKHQYIHCMFLKCFITIIFTVAGFCAAAQIKKKIKKSRRSKTESQFVIAKNDVLFEWEAGRETFDDYLRTLSLPNITAHYGISNRLEVNAETSIVSVTDKSLSPLKKITGTEPLLAGINYLLRKEGYNSPVVIASVQLVIPFLASKNFTANYFAPVMQLDVQQPFNKKLTAGFTPGIFWDGFIKTPSYSYTTSLTYKPVQKWVLSAEVFGFLGNYAPDYNITKHFAVGITGGIGISAAAHKNYAAINGSYGFNTGHKKHS
jgi:hypothetical protein